MDTGGGYVWREGGEWMNDDEGGVWMESEG